jgi:hypothetical protein
VKSGRPMPRSRHSAKLDDFDWVNGADAEAPPPS